MTPGPAPGPHDEHPDAEPGAGDHYFSSTPTAPSRPSRVTLNLPDLSVELGTDRGVFSGDRIDTGTKLLLVEMSVLVTPPWPPGDLVDVGCGYGPIAVALALRHPERTVWAVDPNERARRLCQENAASAGVADRVRVVPPEDFPDLLSVAAVASNPPIRIGKAALHALLVEWLGRLRPGGEAWLVVQRNLGADSLASWLGDQGHVVSRLASRRGYRILQVRAAEPDPPATEAGRAAD